MMLSEGPPSFDEVTTSRTCRDSVEVKAFTSSGMMAPAAVPQVMMSESFHHIEASPPMVGSITFETMKVTAMETAEVRITSWVSGCSKFILSAVPYLPFWMTLFTAYDTKLVTTIITRMAKIHTRSTTLIWSVGAARRMKVIS